MIVVITNIRAITLSITKALRAYPLFNSFTDFHRPNSQKGISTGRAKGTAISRIL